MSESRKPLFHKRLNNNRKDIKNPNATEAFQHFNNLNHAFHKHEKFILIEQLNNIKNTSAEVLKQKLLDKKTKNFNTFWFKSRTKLTPWHGVLLSFTTAPSLCIWIKYMTLMSLGDVR